MDSCDFYKVMSIFSCDIQSQTSLHTHNLIIKRLPAAWETLDIYIQKSKWVVLLCLQSYNSLQCFQLARKKQEHFFSTLHHVFNFCSSI